MTRIDPGPGWRLLKLREKKRAGDQYFDGWWRPTTMIGDIMGASSCPVRRRLGPRITKAIATRATIIAECKDGIRVTRTASNASGLTAAQMKFEEDSFVRQKDRLTHNAPMHGMSPAKYIMLEIQREGEP